MAYNTIFYLIVLYEMCTYYLLKLHIMNGVKGIFLKTINTTKENELSVII